MDCRSSEKKSVSLQKIFSKVISKNTLVRLKTIDSCLCRRQRLWTLEDLREACEEALYEYEGISSISLRTIQRDIELMRSDKLGYNAPIVVRDKKYYTYADPDYSITQLPLSRHDLAELSSAIDIIRHYGGFKGMGGQEDILARMQDRLQSQESHRRVVYIETNDRLKGLDFLGVLYEHTVAKQAIEVKYKSFKARRETVLFISPYLLKEYNNRWFLLGFSRKKQDIMILPLDRIMYVRPDENHSYVENSFFDPDTYLSEMIGVTRNLNSKPEKVTLRITGSHAPYLITKPLHDSQQIVKKEANGDVVISLHVIINHELENKILGLGAFAEVLAPLSLRQTIAMQIHMAASRYRNQNS